MLVLWHPFMQGSCADDRLYRAFSFVGERVVHVSRHAYVDWDAAIRHIHALPGCRVAVKQR